MEWENIFNSRQDEVTRLLVQRGYPGDTFRPTYLMHQRSAAPDEPHTPLAIYSIEEFVAYSRDHSKFITRNYRITKGSHRDPATIHELPDSGLCNSSAQEAVHTQRNSSSI